jgi:pSer/pThr/pTyr-binding forkhead associated (FHA) protein
MLKVYWSNASSSEVPLTRLAASAETGPNAQLFRVGRSPDNDLVLAHPEFPLLISRRHAE